MILPPPTIGIVTPVRRDVESALPEVEDVAQAQAAAHAREIRC
jgi:hypothetical protein